MPDVLEDHIFKPEDGGGMFLQTIMLSSQEEYGLFFNNEDGGVCFSKNTIRSQYKEITIHNTIPFKS